MNNLITVKDLPKELQPYERCFRYGADKLSDAELVAIIIKNGVKGKQSVQLAKELIESKDDKEGITRLMFYTYDELVAIKGIGRVKALQILCLGELSKRISKSLIRQQGLSFFNAESVARYYMEDFRYKTKEETLVLLLDTKGHLIREVYLFTGTVNFVIAEPRDIFIEALKYAAASIILVHNHPSGDPTPSGQDYESTKRVLEAGKIIGIPLIDHIIIGDNTYTSLKEQGRI